MSGKSDGGDNGIAFGLFGVWLLSAFVFYKEVEWTEWWYSFPFIIGYAILGALAMPIIKLFLEFIFEEEALDDGVNYALAFVLWPAILPISAMAAFFVLMGRLAR